MEEKYGTEGNLMSRDLVAREIAMCPGQVYLETAKESIPVTPAIHFFMGGIKVDRILQDCMLWEKLRQNIMVQIALVEIH